jgi:hypothetical protein
MAGLVAASPYKAGPLDLCAKGVAEHAATEAVNNLNKLNNPPTRGGQQREQAQQPSDNVNDLIFKRIAAIVEHIENHVNYFRIKEER